MERNTSNTPSENIACSKMSIPLSQAKAKAKLRSRRDKVERNMVEDLL
ncbi:MAG: hypothetical protein ACTS4U_00340 [Candidatus Hodgkinia cicadicola]